MAEDTGACHACGMMQIGSRKAQPAVLQQCLWKPACLNGAAGVINGEYSEHGSQQGVKCMNIAEKAAPHA